MKHVVACLLTLLMLASVAAAAGTVHVSPAGDDAAPGTAEAPLRTPHAAQALARQQLQEHAEDIEIIFAAGTYLLDKALQLGPEDGAPAGSDITVTWKAAPEAEVVLSGGARISGWERVAGNLWRADVSALKPFRDLFRNGARLTRARTPNGDQLLRVSAVSEDYRTVTLEGLPPELQGEWAGPGAELVIFQNWSITRGAVVACDGNVLTSATPLGWIGHGAMTTVSEGKPAFVEHSRSALDSPGEWYLDAAAGQVLYLAAEGEDLQQVEMFAPQLPQLLVIHGTPELPVRKLRFEGITFAHSAWQLPEFGYNEIQAGHYGTTTQAETHVLQHAVELLHAEECGFSGCAFLHTGAGGVALGRGTRENRIERCRFEDIGGTGVTNGWRGTGEMQAAGAGDYALAADWPEAALAPRGNTITHSTFTRCGAVSRGCVGVYDAFSKGTRITHNHVYDMPYTGISVGYFWGMKPTSQENCLVAYNHIHHVMQKLADGGGIYTLGRQPGTVLRGNLIHDVYRSEFAHGGAPNNGIFFDEGSSAIQVTENIIYSTSGDPIRFNQTDESQLTWDNNYFGVAPDSPEFPAALAAKAGPVETRPTTVPLAVNEDNSHFFGSRSAEDMTLEGLHAFVDQYADSAVTQLFLCPNSMRTSYDSAVWDAIWETGAQTPPTDAFALKWIENARLLHERGLDPYAIWIARSREQGISPWISMRMNDIHNVEDTTHYLHSRFWVEHPEYWRVPNAETGFFERAFDFAHPAVREHHLALLRELLERYDPDGIELDWMRFGWHFAPGKEAAGAEVLTEFMRTVRAMAQAAGEKRGHPVLVSARVPAHPDAARGLGMDGVRWAKEGLVDWLVPTPFWATADFDIPLERWREQLGEAREQVVLAAGMEVLLRAYPGGPQIESDLPAVRGFAAGALHRGAEAIYLFNYMDREPMTGPAGSYQALLQEGFSPATLATKSRRYVATFRDTVPADFDDNAQLPLDLDTSATLRFYTGFAPEGGTALLTLGLAADLPATLAVRLGEQECRGLGPVAQPENAPPAALWLRFECSADALQPGENAFQLDLQAGEPPRIIWAELNVSPSP